MKKILITGGCGYLGSFICEKFLGKNFKVYVVDNNSNGRVFLKDKDINYFRFNFQNTKKIVKLINRFKIENIIHLAAYIDSAESVKKANKYIVNNYENTKKLLINLKNTPIKNFYFASTAAVYGSNLKNKIKENYKKKPKSPYGLSKLKAEQSIIKELKFSDINFVILRLFNIAGAGTRFKLGPFNAKYNHIFNKLIRSPYFKIYGTNYPTIDGTAVRDYVHPEDVAEAFYKSYIYLGKKNINLILNCGSGKPFSVKNVVKYFSQKISHNLKVTEVNRRPGDVSYILSDNSKIKKILKLNFKKSSLKYIVNSLIFWKKTLSKNPNLLK